MIPDWIQLAFAAAIVLAVIWASRRSGQANPETTGRLARRLGTLETKISGCATTAALGVLAAEVRELEAKAATSAEVANLSLSLAHLNGEVGRVSERVSAIGHAADRTEAAVRRIEGYFIEKGVGVKE